MKVLTLTWEFPPIITGGLGMACYGMVKELLKKGIEVDLIMPANELVYFRLRKTEDADSLPVASGDPVRWGGKALRKSAEELRKLIGSPLSVYYSTKHRVAKSAFESIHLSGGFYKMAEILESQQYPFVQVSQYTDMAVQIGSRLDFDVIHAHDWLTYPAGVILKRLCRKPLVAHVHATEFDRAGGPGDGRIHDIEYIGLEYADRVITVSDYTARTAIEKYLISPEKTATVHNAYSVSSVEVNQRRIFKEPMVLFMGRITLQKGPDYFLEVARKVLRHNRKVRFVMAGAGDMERQVLHRAAWLGLGTRFLAGGFLQRGEVESILSSADIFILPSVSEPFGIAPLEAMSQGVAAIVSKDAGVAEVINNAYKVDFWDTDQMARIILDLIEDRAKLAAMSIAGKREVSKMTWGQAVQKITDVFYEVGARV
ncbi:MAG: glycosyltransferase family 4 protein [Planctomycetota bacterium]